eukprot:267058_1
MANFPNCNNATYITTMSELSNDHLSRGDILASENCEYLLRAEFGVLSLYSSSQQSMINQWYIYDNVWSIKSHSKKQILTLSDDGCLTWEIYKYKTIITQFCDLNNDIITSTSIYNNTNNLIPNNSNNNKYNMESIFVPLTLCIVAAILGIIFFIGVLRKNNLLKTKKRKETLPSVSQPSSVYGTNVPIPVDMNTNTHTNTHPVIISEQSPGDDQQIVVHI